MNDKNIIAGVLVLMVAVGAILYAISGNTTAPTGASTKLAQEASSTLPASGPNLALAQCLKDKGVIFYGAFWCPHCKKQVSLDPAQKERLQKIIDSINVPEYKLPVETMWIP